jgi:hypothetical protein
MVVDCMQAGLSQVPKKLKYYFSTCDTFPP